MNIDGLRMPLYRSPWNPSIPISPRSLLSEEISVKNDHAHEWIPYD